MIALPGKFAWSVTLVGTFFLAAKAQESAPSADVLALVPEVTPIECQTPLLGLAYASMDMLGAWMIVSEYMHPVHDAGTGMPTMIGAGLIVANRIIAYPVNSVYAKNCLDSPKRTEPVANDQYRLGTMLYIGSGFANNGSIGLETRLGNHSLIAELYLATSTVELQNDEGYSDEFYTSATYRYSIFATPMSRLQLGTRLIRIQQTLYSEPASSEKNDVQYVGQLETALEITQFKRFPIAIGIGYQVWESRDNRHTDPWDARVEIHGLFLEK